jgi:hypothetical protein
MVASADDIPVYGAQAESMSNVKYQSKSRFAAFGCAAALVVLPAAIAIAVPVAPTGGAQVSLSAAAISTAHGSSTSTKQPAASDTSPSCPGAYLCLQSGTDPNVPYGTDPSVPYGTGQWNSRPQTGHGSGSYLGGGV